MALTHSKQVAVVTPVYKKDLAANELISLRHLNHYLPDTDKFVMLPESFDIQMSSFQFARFPDAYFLNVDTYSRLLLSTPFYERFIDYDYILIYQLDALIFSDRLLDWCNAGFDYIGAPWFYTEQGKSLPQLSRCGNGGLSLRSISAFLRVLNSPNYTTINPHSYIEDVFLTPLPDVDEEQSGYGKLTKRLKVFREIRRGIDWYTSNYTLNEDHFWSDRAKLFLPDFKIAPVEVGLRFAFEKHPEICFEQNNHQLPFGCHAWDKWGRTFWEPYLLK